MTIDKAIKKIQGRMDTCFLNDEPYPSELSMAISALEKQKPKKPSLPDLCDRMYCMKCGASVAARHNYCCMCGQKLKEVNR